MKKSQSPHIHDMYIHNHTHTLQMKISGINFYIIIMYVFMTFLEPMVFSASAFR